MYGGYDYGTFYADITSFPIICAGNGDEVCGSALVDNKGDTYSTIQGEVLQWDFMVPVPVKIIGFSMLSADDAALDPANVTIYGLDENGVKTQITNRNVSFNSRAGRVTATISTSQLYSHFQLVVNQTASGGNVARLAEFELFGTAIVDGEGDDNFGLMLPVSVLASAEGVSSTEKIEKISDQSRTTRYRTDYTDPVVITYSLETPAPIHCYTVTAAKDGAANDPSSWIFEASNDGVNWDVLDSRQSELFSSRYATQVYMISEDLAPTSYSQYRLTVNAVNGGTQLHIGELQLLNLTAWYLNEDVRTPVTDVTEQTTISDTGVYSLSGQLMGTSLRQVFNSLPKGIYIVGGKKIQKK